MWSLSLCTDLGNYLLFLQFMFKPRFIYTYDENAVSMLFHGCFVTD